MTGFQVLFERYTRSPPGRIFAEDSDVDGPLRIAKSCAAHRRKNDIGPHALASGGPVVSKELCHSSAPREDRRHGGHDASHVCAEKTSRDSRLRRGDLQNQKLAARSQHTRTFPKNGIEIGEM